MKHNKWLNTLIQIIFYGGGSVLGATLAILGGFQVPFKYFIWVVLIIGILWSICLVYLGEFLFNRK